MLYPRGGGGGGGHPVKSDLKSLALISYQILRFI